MVVVAGIAARTQTPAPAGAAPAAPATPGLTLVSTAFMDGGVIPNRYTQVDPNPISPKLDWSNVPAGVTSFALIMHDPDTAPQKNSEDILHWLIFNISGSSRGLPENVPVGPRTNDGAIQLKGFRAIQGYMGPGAAAPGPYHHYTFELFALDTMLQLGPDASRAEVLQAMNGHVVAKAAVEARFHR
jgi:Raf kinase inhibitor-like YbhB/YbcL family protein